MGRRVLRGLALCAPGPIFAFRPSALRPEQLFADRRCCSGNKALCTPRVGCILACTPASPSAPVAQDRRRGGARDGQPPTPERRLWGSPDLACQRPIQVDRSRAPFGGECQLGQPLVERAGIPPLRPTSALRPSASRPRQSLRAKFPQLRSGRSFS